MAKFSTLEHSKTLGKSQISLFSTLDFSPLRNAARVLMIVLAGTRNGVTNQLCHL
jgi:hypothetical protein